MNTINFTPEEQRKFRFWNTEPVNALAEAKKRGLAYTSPGRPLMAESPFPFGEHLGKTMRQVPVAFYRWVDSQPWAATWRDWLPVRGYLERHPQVLSTPDSTAPCAPVVIYASTIEPALAGARGIFKDGAARLYVPLEAHLEHLRCFASGALDMRPDWLRPADDKAPPHFLLTPARQQQALDAGAELASRRTLAEHTFHWRRGHGTATAANPAGHTFVRVMPDGSEQCTKHCYSKIEAETAVNDRTQGRQRIRRHRPEYLRAYECPRCGHWHLTSRQPWEGTQNHD